MNDGALDLSSSIARASRETGMVTRRASGASRELRSEKLEGIPLAIELAAARMRVLDTGRRLLNVSCIGSTCVGAPDHAQRKRDAGIGSLRSAIEWSWTICETWEQRAFAQASIFESGFSFEAAEAVIDVGVPALDVLHALADKSLLRAYAPEGFPGELRYRMLETVREFAGEKARRERRRQRVRTCTTRDVLICASAPWSGRARRGTVAWSHHDDSRIELEKSTFDSCARARSEKSDRRVCAPVLRSFRSSRRAGRSMRSSRCSIVALDEPLLRSSAPADLRARYLIVRGRSRQVTGTTRRERNRLFRGAAWKHAKPTTTS